MSTDDYTLQLDTSQYTQSMSQASAVTQQFAQSTSSLTANSKILGASLLLMVPAVRILEKGFGGFTNQAAEMEQRLSGLRATAAVSGQSMDKLTQSAMGLARTFPIGNAAAIQLVSQLQNLGISGAGSEAKINSLAKTFINLAASTGSSVGSITQSMVQVSRAFGDSTLDPKRITRFGDSLTTLVAKFGGTADGITQFTKQISPFARQAGLGESATMGIAAAFSKLGDDGYAAGTAVSKVLSDISKSVRDGSPQIQAYAAVVGQTTDNFTKLFKSNPGEQLAKIMDAFGNGTQGQRSLEMLGFDSMRVQKAIGEAAQTGGLRAAINTSVGAYGTGSTDKAAAQAFTGLNDSLTKLTSASEQAASAFGEPFLKPLTQASDVLTTIASKLGGFAASGSLQFLVKTLSELGLAYAGLKIASGFGQAGIVRDLATRSLIPTMGRAGKLLAASGGDMSAAEATAAERATMFGRQGRAGRLDERALRTYRDVGAIPDEDRTGYQNSAYTFAQERLQGQQMMDERFQATLAEARGRMSPEDYAAFEKKATADYRRGLAGTAARAPFRVARKYGRTFVEGVSRYQTQMARMRDAQVESPLNTMTGSGPTGTMRQPLQDFKDAAAGRGPGSGWSGRLGGMVGAGRSGWATLRADHALESGSEQAALTANYATAGLRANLVSAGRTGMSLGRGLFAAAGGGAGLAIMGGSILAEQAWSGHQAANQRFKDQYSGFREMSTTGTLDQYRDSIGKATDSTVTLAESLHSAAQAVQASVTDINKARELSAADRAAADAMTSPITHRYSGSNVEIARQISGLQAGGIGAQELQAVKLDLYRQLGGTRTKSILGKVDTSGKALASGPGGTGEASGDFIHASVRGIIDSYNTTGRNWLYGGGLHSTGAGGRSNWDVMLKGARLDNTAHVTKETKSQIDTLIQGMTAQGAAQGETFGGGYALQERLRNADQVMADLRKNGAAEDVIRTTAQGLEASLDAGNVNIPIEFLKNKKNNFSDLLAVFGSKDYRQNLQNTMADTPGFSTKPGDIGASASAVRGAVGTALAGMGVFGAQFDNTRKGGIAQSLSDVTTGSKVGDVAAQNQAAGAFIANLIKSGQSLDQIAEQAAVAANKLHDVGTTSDELHIIQARAIQQQAYQDQFGGGQAGIAHKLGRGLAAIRNTENTPEAEAARVQGKQDIVDALASEQDLYRQRIQMNFDFVKSTTRQDAQRKIDLKQRQDDFNTQMVGSEHDRLRNIYLANRNFHEQMLRSQRDFNINLARQAEDAAKSLYDPYKRIGVEQIWDANTLLQNLSEQTKAAQEQIANLSRLRKAGLSAQAIENLSLSDASHAQQVAQLVNDSGQDPNAIARLNKSVASRAKAVGALFQDPGNVGLKRQKEDYARSLKDSTALFVQSGADQTRAFQIQTQRAYAQFNLGTQREAAAFKLQRDEMVTDLKDAQSMLDASLADLQKLAHRGTLASMSQFRSAMHDSMTATETAINKMLGKAQSLVDLVNKIQNDPSFGTIQNDPSFGTQPGGHAVAPDYVPVHTSSSSDQNFWDQFSGYASGQTVSIGRTGAAGSGAGVLFPSLHAAGGIMTRPHLGMVGEGGPEAVIPLNQRGISVLAAALTEAYRGMSAQQARSHVTWDSSSHHYDHSVDVSGPITVVAQDPNEMGHKLAAKARARNLTATPTRKS